MVLPDNYNLSTSRQLAYHHCNSCSAHLLLVVQKMDYYAIHYIEWISIRKTNCTIHWVMFCLDGYSVIPFEQLAPAVNNNGTISHMEREVCVLQVVTSCKYR